MLAAPEDAHAPAPEPDERFEIQLSHVCNNRCVFCVSGQMTELRMAKPTPLGPLKERFDEARARGITKVTLLGGEPTIHPTFFPCLEYALELGFETIVIFTNGTRLDKQDFIDRVMAYGPDKFQWRISIQGWNEAAHDGTTKKVGSFAKIVKGLETLGPLGQHISCNMCVVEQNYRSLVDLPEFVQRYNIKQVHLDMVRPRDSGTRTEDYLDGILPDYEALGDVMRTMFEKLEALSPDFDLNVGNLPFCQLPEWSHRIHHGGAMTFTASADGPGVVSETWDKYEDKRTDKHKLDSCRSCVFEPRCDGFVELYAKRRGTEAFRPVSLRALAERDPAQRAFLHHLSPALRSLGRTFGGQDATIPKLLGAQESEWDRTCVLEFGLADGRFSVLIRPGATAGEHDVTTSAFVMDVVSWRALPPQSLLGATSSVAAHIARTLELDARPDVDLNAAAFWGKRGLAVDTRERSSMERGAFARLIRHSHLAGCELAGATSSEHGIELRFAVEGSEARLMLATRGQKFAPTWSETLDELAHQRSLVRAVSAALRG